jgi:hypothetical protein
VVRTTLFTDPEVGREEPQMSCKSAGRRSGALRLDTCGFGSFRVDLGRGGAATSFSRPPTANSVARGRPTR